VYSWFGFLFQMVGVVTELPYDNRPA